MAGISPSTSLSQSGQSHGLRHQGATEKSDVDLLVDSRLRGLHFVGFLDDIQRALGKDVDLFDVSHIQPDSLIDREIRQTGVTIYEK